MKKFRSHPITSYELRIRKHECRASTFLVGCGIVAWMATFCRPTAQRVLSRSGRAKLGRTPAPELGPTGSAASHCSLSLRVLRLHGGAAQHTKKPPEASLVAFFGTMRHEIQWEPRSSVTRANQWEPIYRVSATDNIRIGEGALWRSFKADDIGSLHGTVRAFALINCVLRQTTHKSNAAPRKYGGKLRARKHYRIWLNWISLLSRTSSCRVGISNGQVVMR